MTIREFMDVAYRVVNLPRGLTTPEERIEALGVAQAIASECYAVGEEILPAMVIWLAAEAYDPALTDAELVEHIRELL